VLRHHLIPAFGHLKVRALHLGHVKTCLAEKRAAGYSKDMLRLIRAALSVIWGMRSRRSPFAEPGRPAGAAAPRPGHRR
jgi:hypothetical protein